ncbi:MAG TPA: hypothetical protein VJ772_04380 [Nitrososphaeraceae archaeon]|nr:hypothetical protein [Nitrososphaeraceae archaeon]
MKSDNNSEHIVTSWAVESNYSNQEFKGYNPALSTFNKISKEGTPVILYEIRRNRLDGSIVKKTPILNSKKLKTKSTLFQKIIQK